MEPFCLSQWITSPPFFIKLEQQTSLPWEPMSLLSLPSQYAWARGRNMGNPQSSSTGTSSLSSDEGFPTSMQMKSLFN